MAVELTEGKSYLIKATTTNMSTRAGVPVAATLTVNIAAVVDSQTILDDSAVYGFAAEETHAFEFPMAVPMGTGGKAGAVVAEVLDPSGNKLADGSLDVVIATVAPPPIAGEITHIWMWHEPLGAWGIVWYKTEFPPGLMEPEIPLNEDIYFVPCWYNRSEVSIVGHVDLKVTYPDGTKVSPLATAGQDAEVLPGKMQPVEFYPTFAASQEGTYTVVVTLSSAGQVLDSVTFTLVTAAPVGLLLNPGFETGSLSPWVFWTNYGGRCSGRVLDEAVYEGLYAARLAASTGYRYVIGTLTQTIDWRDEYRGKSFTFGAMAKSAPKNNMSIQIDDGVGVSSSPVRSGSNLWEELLVSRVIAANATKLAVVLKFAPHPSLGTRAMAFFDATFLE